MGINYTDKLNLRVPDLDTTDDWGTPFIENIQIQSSLWSSLMKGNKTINGLVPSVGTGLAVNYTEGQARVAGTTYYFPAGSVSVSASATNYIYVNDSGSVVASTTPPTGDYTLIAVADAGASAVDRVADVRVLLDPDVIGRVDKIVASSTNIVDVFIYDTRKDSDGGAWVKKQDAATTLMLFIADGSGIKCFDLTDVDTPEISALALVLSGVSSIVARNRVLAVGTSSGVKTYDVGDSLRLLNTYSITTTPAIVNDTIKDIAITILPNAPTDPATGLPVPTIAVATNGGVSVIKDDGTVNSIATAGGSKVTFVGSTGYVIWNKDVFYSPADEVYISYVDALSDYRFYSSSTIPSITNSDPHNAGFHRGIAVKNDGTIIGAQYVAGIYEHPSLVFLKENPSTPSSGMVAYVTKDWTSGWMPGDIRLATLADTTAETITGSGELVTNGTFDTDITGWTDASTGAGASISWNGTDARLQLSSDAVDTAKAQQAISTTSGENYLLAVDVYTNSVTLNIGTTAGDSDIKSTTLSTGRNLVSFDATSSVTYLSFEYLSGSGTTTADIDNVTCKLAEKDRSVKDHGLHIVGTLSKAAVATGAELVAYSGFGASNYCNQPYNPDYDFGTDDFSVAFWLKEADNSTTLEGIFERGYASGAYFRATVDSGGTLSFSCSDGTTTRTATTSNAIDDNSWHFFVLTYSGGTLTIYQDGESIASATGAALGSLDNSSAILRVGDKYTSAPLANGKLAKFRISKYAPSADQIRHIYETEKYLFQDNAACTIGGTSSAVRALAYDEDTDRLFVGTDDGTSVFSGLRRVDYIDSTGTQTSDSIKALAATSGMYAIGTAAETVVYVPALTLREELGRAEKQREVFGQPLEPFWFAGDGTTTDFTLEPGWKPKFVYNGGLLVKEGSSDDYTVKFDGFRYTVSFAVAPTSGNDICVMARRQ